MNDEPTDSDRYPTLGEAGQRMLEILREHPAAPIWRNASGNRLTAGDIEYVRGCEHADRHAPIEWQPGQAPAWLAELVTRCCAEVPYYRALELGGARFEELPTIARADLAADIARFVPDTVPLERLINFRTTGTTGEPLLVPSHPQVAARYLHYHKRALARSGVELSHGAGQVGVVLIGCQRRCFTYVSVTPTMGESGLAKINLHPADWRDPADRARYLDALGPELIAGDPISYAELLRVPVDIHPRALLSVGMTLSAGLRAQLEQRFDCPVLDLYSLNEAGPVGVFDADAGGHVLLQPMLYVELLDHAGRAVAPGERGEITLSGGFNYCLPLLRYRTGDFASLRAGSDAPVLVDLSGRAPVRFRRDDGVWLNNIDVTHALAALPLPQYGLHQRADGSLVLRLAPSGMGSAALAIAALEALFGVQGVIALEPIAAEDKIVQYSSALDGALA